MGKFNSSMWSILLIVAISCTEQVTPSSYLYTQVFTGEKSKTWKLKFMEQTLNGKAEAFNEPCASDDEFVFYANSERAFKATTGSSKCYQDEAEVINDSWSFNNATATLTMVFPLLTESSLPFIVREAKKNKFELEYFINESNTESYRFHFESKEN